MKKTFLSALLLLACITFSFGQGKTMEERAKIEIEKINANIISSNPSVALSEVQKEQIANFYIEKFKGLEELKNLNKSEEEAKELRKELHTKCAQNLSRHVFTPEQKLAMKETREKNIK